MTILDKYVAKNFIIGYIIAFSVLIGLRITIDLSINLDEFAEHLGEDAKTGATKVLLNILTYYGNQSAIYFRDFAGMITVVAAVFSLGKMTRNNELIAVMASGVSLKRVILPIILLALILSALLVIDQELIIPKLANNLVRSHDANPGEEFYDVWFINDSKGSLFCTKKFDEKTGTVFHPSIIIRKEIKPLEWESIGWIKAEKADYDYEKNGWRLEKGTYTAVARSSDPLEDTPQPEKIEFYQTDITPESIPIRRQENYKSFLSFKQLLTLTNQRTRVKDQAELFSQMHFHITEPIINMVMLMVALPVLVCREPKAMKTAILTSFAITTACFILTFICKMFAAEVVFDQVRPELWAWMPVFIFLPIAFIELDSMRT